MYTRPSKASGLPEARKYDLTISAPLIVTSSRVSFSKKVRCMSVKGSRLAPNLLFRRRAPRATPRTSPDFSVMHRTILSASASLYVCRTMACVSTKPITLYEDSQGHLPGHEVEQPGQREADADEFQENLQAVSQTAALALTADD